MKDTLIRFAELHNEQLIKDADYFTMRPMTRDEERDRELEQDLRENDYSNSYDHSPYDR